MVESDRSIRSIYNDLVDDVSDHLGDGTTTGSELELFGKFAIGRSFKGAFPSDRFPAITSNGTHYFILNVDTSGQKGSHWIGIVIRNKKLFYYDSFGRPLHKLIPHLDVPSGVKIASAGTSQPEQAMVETNCGQRVLAWLILFHRLGEHAALTISE
jgi:hypothetical protein